MRALCSFTLACEALVVCFAALVALKMTDLPAGTIWAVAGPFAVLCLLLCGLLGRSWAIGLGWALQAGLILSGLLVPMMYGLGAVFAAIWFAAVSVGRKVDAAKAARAAEAADGASDAGNSIPQQANPANGAATPA
jgi:hypothetical protein